MSRVGQIQRTDICGRIADRNLAIAPLANVSLDISGHSLDEGSSVRGRDVIDKLVTRVEQEGVVVFLEYVNGRKDVLEIDRVVGLIGFVSTNGVFGCVDVQSKVDASGGQLVHALVVVLAVVDGVDTDGVDVQLLESVSRHQQLFICED